MTLPIGQPKKCDCPEYGEAGQGHSFECVFGKGMKQSPYEQLRAEINRMFPERLKLEFGCEVRHRNFGMVWLVARMFPPVPGSSAREFRTDTNDHFSVDEVEILGKPLEIADVLRSLPRRYAIDAMGGLFEMTTGKGEDEEGGIEIRWIVRFDLSKPVSHPANAPACAAVVERLTKNSHTAI